MAYKEGSNLMRYLSHARSQKLRKLSSSAGASLGYASLRRYLPLLLLSSGTLGACLDTIEPPPPTPQATAVIPERIYLRAESNSNICSRLIRDNQPVDGLSETFEVEDNTVYNCFVEVDTPETPSLTVDVHEVTTLQYQLCVDSSACAAPEPSDFNPNQLCRSEDDFDDCPMVKVNHQEAIQYCEWVGRRLPTTLELIFIRQLNTQVEDNNFPIENPAFLNTNSISDSCSAAVLGNGECSRAYPVMSGNEDILRQADSNGRLTEDIYGLLGNVSEIVSDLMPINDPNENPWFCAVMVEANDDGLFPDECPTVEDNENVQQTCIWGTRGTTPEPSPICVAQLVPNEKRRILRTAGDRPVVVGGSYTTRLVAPDENTQISPPTTFSARSLAGLYGRRVLAGDDNLGLSEDDIGFRCVGQRSEIGADFEDLLSIKNFGEN